MYEFTLSLFIKLETLRWLVKDGIQSQEVILVDPSVYLLTWLVNIVSQALQEL